MSTSIGTAFVDVAGNWAPFESEIAKRAPLIKQKFGKVGLGVATGAAVGGVAIAGMTKGLYELGESFHKHYKTIRVGTGATGTALKGLQDDFKAVAKTRPSENFDQVATAIADLNTRLGVTGEPLQQLAGQFDRLSGLTGTDIKTNIKSVTRAFGDWQVSTDKQSSTLDYFFRASQASGATVDQLADQVVKFGAPLRQVGFSLDEATSMFAAFEKAGVNTQTMMPGIRFALKSFLAEGVDPAKGLKDAFAGIADGSIDAQEAIKIFGQRAGADMIEAVKQGRFDLDDFTDSLRNNGETIASAAGDVGTVSGKLSILKSKVLVGLEPLATKVYNTFNDLTAKVLDFVTAIENGDVSWFNDLKAAIGDIFTVIRDLGPVWKMLWDGAREFLGLIAKQFKATFGVIRGIIRLFKALFTGDWKGIKEAVGEIVRNLKELVINQFKAITTPVRTVWKNIKDTVKGAISDAWNWIKDTVGGIGKWFGDRFDAVVKAGGNFARSFRDKILDGVGGGLNAVIDFVNKIIGVLNKIPFVEIQKIGRIMTPSAKANARTKFSFADGGVSNGAYLKSPIVLMGEEAPRHPEYVIPTNPAYRRRAIDLYNKLGRDLGVQGYALGGILGKAKDLTSGALKKAAGVATRPAKHFIGMLPQPHLPDWLMALAGALRDGAAGSIKKTIPKNINLQGAMALARQIGLAITSTTGGKHAKGSWHYQGRAFDAAGSPSAMLQFAKLMAERHGRKLLELFYTPLGYSIKNGHRVAPIAAGDHYDHVHAALARGGKVLRSGRYTVAEDGSEDMKIPHGTQAILPRGAEVWSNRASRSRPIDITLRLADGLDRFIDDRIAYADEKVRVSLIAGPNPAGA